MKHLVSIIIIKFSYHLLTFLLTLFCGEIKAQTSYLPPSTVSEYVKGENKDIYGISRGFIENIGQYGEFYNEQPEMGKIIYAYEGFGIPVLFTEKGVIYLHRKLSGPTLAEKEIEEHKKKQKKKEEEIEELNISDKSITITWADANKDVDFIDEQPSNEYNT